jgi:hypothetical protein
MLSEEDLKKKAQQDCLKHAEGTVRGELKVELGDFDRYWSRRELRHVFDQAMVIWRKSGTFEILLDENNKPVGFVDPDKWDKCQWQPMGDWEVRAMVQQTGLVAEGCGIENICRGERNCVEATVIEKPAEPDSRRFTVKINPSRRALISMELQPARPKKPEEAAS